MDQNYDIAAYRNRLLDNLKTGSNRTACGPSDSVHVFVNQQRIGSLDGAGGEAALQVRTESPVGNVQLRSEDGVLLGGLSAPEYGVRSARIGLARDTIELRVQNYAQGGSVNALFIPAPSLWHRARRALSGIAGQAALPPVPSVTSGMRAIVFTQALLAMMLAGLAAERFIDRRGAEHTPPAAAVAPAQAPWAAPLAEVTKLQQQLAELSQMQARAVDTIQAQQQGIGQLQRTMAKLSSNQETVASGVLTVRQEIEQRRKGAGREVDRVARMLMSKAQTEQDQLEAEVHSLTVANDRLSREMMELEQHHQDLKKRLKTAGVEVSKATVSVQDKPVTAQQAGSPQVADARPGSAQMPFLFWVTFSDGTSQESIDQWVLDMRGRKGALSDGWQAVEIMPPTEPMERFLDQLKQAKIVKAVRVSR